MYSYRTPSKQGSSSTSQQSTSSSQGGPQGGGEQDARREVYLRQAQDVVDESNELAAKGEDQVWLAQNGSNKGVFADGGDKPDEWKRGISTKDGEFGYVHGAEATGIDDLEEFQEQIAHDLNFNGVFDAYTSEQEFVSALVSQYGSSGGPDRKEQVRAIAENLWSYATEGQDVEGNTDVAELQGLLFALDPLIAEASQSNTTHDNNFTIPGTSIELGTGGDDYYGRATMLECRLLSSVLEDLPTPQDDTPVLDQFEEQIETPEPSIDRTPEDDDVFGRTHFMTDVSGSMYGDFRALSDYFDEVDFGETRIGGLNSYYDELNWHNDGKAVPMEEGRDIMSDLARVGLHNKDFNLSGKKDKAEAISGAFKNIGGGKEESPITTALTMLEGMDDTRIDRVEGEQIIIATDEGDSKPGRLRELRDMAREMGVLVKVLYFTSSKGIYEININKIKDETLDAFEAQLEAARENGGTGFNSTKGRMVSVVRHDDRRTEEEDGRVVHEQLLWHRMAMENDPAFTVMKSVDDRESRRR